MKIVDRATFLTLPPGTVFFGADGYSNPYRHLSIKVETFDPWPQATAWGDDEHIETLAYVAGATEFGDKSSYVEAPTTCAAIWEPIQAYPGGSVIVFEADDVRKLRDLLTDALTMTGGEASK